MKASDIPDEVRAGRGLISMGSGSRLPLAEVAEVYRAARLRGEPPTKAVVKALGVPGSTAGRWIGQARAAGLLPGTTSGRSTVGDHEPRRARWTDASESWLACRCCRTPWPCGVALRGDSDGYVHNGECRLSPAPVALGGGPHEPPPAGDGLPDSAASAVAAPDGEVQGELGVPQCGGQVSVGEDASAVSDGHRMPPSQS